MYSHLSKHICVWIKVKSPSKISWSIYPKICVFRLLVLTRYHVFGYKQGHCTVLFIAFIVIRYAYSYKVLLLAMGWFCVIASRPLKVYYSLSHGSYTNILIEFQLWSMNSSTNHNYHFLRRNYEQAWQRKVVLGCYVLIPRPEPTCLTMHFFCCFSEFVSVK